MLRRLLALVALCVAAAAPRAEAADPPPAADRRPSRWDVVKGEGFAIAVPRNWGTLDETPRHMVLFRQGDGIGVPALDETGAPLQIGITVERFPGAKDSLQESVKKLVASAKANPRLELVGEAATEPLKLSDGTEAVLLTTEFVKEGRRRSLQMKLVARGKGDVDWVAGGFLVGGKESKTPTKDSATAKWLRAHVVSFCLDAGKLDEAALAKAYPRPGLGEAAHRRLEALLAAQSDPKEFGRLLDQVASAGEYDSVVALTYAMFELPWVEAQRPRGRGDVRMPKLAVERALDGMVAVPEHDRLSAAYFRALEGSGDVEQARATLLDWTLAQREKLSWDGTRWSSRR